VIQKSFSSSETKFPFPNVSRLPLSFRDFLNGFFRSVSGKFDFLVLPAHRIYIFAPADFQRTFPASFKMVTSLQIHGTEHPGAYGGDMAGKDLLQPQKNSYISEKLKVTF
jgi:hypothetical protein